jgi:hypothetical protein
MKVSRFLPVVAVLCLLVLPGVALADSFTVFVGYADTLRPSGFFPSIWIGDPNVVSQTTLPGTFDSGAVRIDNTGATPITITNFTVTLNGGAPSFSIWGPLTINPGKIGIFTQTASFNFDSSDSGPFGGLPPADLAPTVPGNNLIGGCSSAAAVFAAALPSEQATCNSHIPVVTFMENGTAITAKDTGHILNTGGWDFVNNGVFGEDGNESINWNLIGSEPNRGGTSVPEPSSLFLLCSGLLSLGGLAKRKLPSKASF